MNLKFIWPILIWSALLFIVINDALEDANPAYQFSMNMLGFIFTMGIVGLIKPQWIFVTNRITSLLVFLGLMILEIVFIFNFDTEIGLAMEQKELALKEASKANAAAIPLPSTNTTTEKLEDKELAKEEAAVMPTTKTDATYKNSNSIKYAECKSFCALKFSECTKYMHEISPEDCANVSNNCLYQCKSYFE